jgi:malate dehydrogenase (quinone)
MHFNEEVRDLRRDGDNRWYVRVKGPRNGPAPRNPGQFVFIGAGGGSLPLLEKSDIPEGRGFGASP